jgi:hypothetical protein
MSSFIIPKWPTPVFICYWDKIAMQILNTTHWSEHGGIFVGSKIGSALLSSVPTLTVYFKPPTTWTVAIKSSLLECRSWWEVLLVQLGLVLPW